MENSEVERLKRETHNLERLLSDLKAELMTRQGQSNVGKNMQVEYEDWEDEKVGFEI